MISVSRVTVVGKSPHGTLAVGISTGKPFAMSNRCRHLFASLGNGHVTDDGCLQCPWHAARYDVTTGKMVRGPQGAFKPLAGAIRATTGARALKTFPVEVKGEIRITGTPSDSGAARQSRLSRRSEPPPRPSIPSGLPHTLLV
jgi:nitrite reductase/ring-hydroxylating ferredoxin subunit